MAKENIVEEVVVEEKKASKKEASVPVKNMAIAIVSGQYGTGDTLSKAIKEAGLNEKEVMAEVKRLR